MSGLKEDVKRLGLDPAEALRELERRGGKAARMSRTGKWLMKRAKVGKGPVEDRSSKEVAKS